MNYTNNNWIPIQSELGLVQDGIAGPKTLAALAQKFGCAASWPKVQEMVGVETDGIPGSNTIHSIKVKLGILSSFDANNSSNKFANPVLSQVKVRTGTTIYGKAGDEGNLVSVSVPPDYPLTYEGKPVKTIRIHKLVADRLKMALKEIAYYYMSKHGSIEAMKKAVPGIFIYGGSYNYRPVRGGTVSSLHSWGLALDFDASQNGNSQSAKQGARLARPEYNAFFDIWEKHGFYSLGRRADRDWMHIQAAAWV